MLVLDINALERKRSTKYISVVSAMFIAIYSWVDEPENNASWGSHL